MKNDLKIKIREASFDEQRDIHLDADKKIALIAEIREEENIDPEVTDEDIYESYVIDGE